MKSKFLLLILVIFVFSCTSLKGASMPKNGNYQWLSGADLSGISKKN